MLPAVRMAELRLLARRPQGQDSADLWLVRPLLEVERVEIERYCRDHDLDPRFDRSNLDTTLYRNKLRHELLPYLEDAFKPGFRDILRRSARVVRNDYDLLCALRDQAWQQSVCEASEDAVTLDRAAWQALHPSLQRATLRHAVQHLRWTLRDVSFAHVEAAVRVGREGRVGAQATLPQGVMLTVGYRTLIVADAGYVPEPDFCALSVDRQPLTVPGRTQMPGLVAVSEVVDKRALPEDWADNADPWRATLDADVVGTGLALRRRQDGDRFCPLGLEGRHKLVSELLINEKVPAWWRDRVPLLVRSDGEIMWVCGWRVDDRARVTEYTSRVLVLHLCETDRNGTDVRE
jgi:tRNA(Ile)-lysidine synthase